MLDSNFKHVLYFTVAWGGLAAVLIAAQPGPVLRGVPHFVKPAQAGEVQVSEPAAKPARLLFASVLELAE